MKKISIIIPVKEVNDYIRQAMKHYAHLKYDDYEILIFPDHPSNEEFPHTRIIPSGEVGPADKRDMALQYAEGEIFAFIDDDAYPRMDWLVFDNCRDYEKLCEKYSKPFKVIEYGHFSLLVWDDGISIRD